jgi:hypothetical protein
MRTFFILLAAALPGAQTPSVAIAAAKFLPEVNWRAESSVSADFTCRGRQESAIVGTTSKEIIIAIFVDGVGQKPEVLRYSAKMRDARTAKLTTETLDYDPKDEDAGDLRGFRRSKTCMGLSLSDEKIDSAHIYWNHEAKRFDSWVR